MKTYFRNKNAKSSIITINLPTDKIGKHQFFLKYSHSKNYCILQIEEWVSFIFNSFFSNWTLASLFERSWSNCFIFVKKIYFMQPEALMQFQGSWKIFFENSIFLSLRIKIFQRMVFQESTIFVKVQKNKFCTLTNS